MKKLFTFFVASMLLSLGTIYAQSGEVIDRFYWEVTTNIAYGDGYNPDGTTGMPGDMFDDSGTTFFAFVKSGKKLNDFSQPDDELVSFTIDMGYEEEFNHILWMHRTNHAYNYLRVYAIDIEGSNDGENFTKINTDGIVWIPNGAGYSGTKTNKEEAYHEIRIPQSSYRYVRVTVVKWSDNYKGGDYPVDDPLYTGDGATSGNTCQIGEFGLMQLEGANITALNAAFENALEISTDDYPLGNDVGEYSEELWNALQDKIVEVSDFIGDFDTTVEQETVDALVAELNKTIKDFKDSKKIIWEVANVYDRSSWTVTTQTIDDYGHVPDGETGKPEHILDGVGSTFLSLVKPGKSYKPNEEVEYFESAGFIPGFTVDTKQNTPFDHILWQHRAVNSFNFLRVFAIDLEGSDDGEEFTPIVENLWIPNKAGYSSGAGVPDPDIYQIAVPQSNYRYIRANYVVWSDVYEGGMFPEEDPLFTEDGAASGSTVQVAEFGLRQVQEYTSVGAEKASDLNIFISNRMVQTTIANAQLIVYNLNGQQLDAKKQLQPGVYIVQVEGLTGAQKVLVK